jgi:nucleotide-binding universal stress UspA family protein
MASMIVVAVDGSEVSEEAVKQAVELARQRQTALAGFFVIDCNWADYIGNDWQSTKESRQGFLDYMREEQEALAQSAREQFERLAGNLSGANFTILAGDPATEMIRIANGPDTGLMITSKRVFQVNGRPSLKALAKTLAQKVTKPMLLMP